MKLARYEVVRELGKGAMGIVYLAKDPLIGRLVALKTIRPATGDDDEAKEFQERFVREAQAAGILSHSAIVTVHDIGQDPESGVSFIAMEYIEGSNLKEVLQQGTPFDHFQVAEVVSQVADAIDYAHSKGIIHRDVKPANIILCGEARAKITDFGIAKIASGVSNLTTTGQFLGTPNYMAPEQIKGTKIDGRTDIFSLGIVFYEALSRRKPFGGDSLTTISYKIVHEPFPPLRDIDPSIPEGFEEIIGRCLAKDPADRYQRARELANDIRAIVRGEALERQVDSSAFEETVMSHDGEKIPTMEIPFPEADSEATAIGSEGRLESSATRARRAAAGATAATAAPVAAATPAARTARRAPSAIARPAAAQLRQLITSKISAPVFFGIIAIILIPLTIGVIAIKQGEVPVPEVDEQRAAVVARQRLLRQQGTAHLRRGNVEAAYASFQELHKIAPKSPMVINVLGKLDEIRIQDMTQQQRLGQAKTIFDEGRLLYDERNYEDAIPLFEEAFHLDPNLNEAVNYLKMSREQLAVQARSTERAETRAELARVTEQGSQSSAQPNGQTTSQPARQQPATLVTSFKGTVNDGYILVKVNGETIVYENLSEEPKGFLRRRVPRDIAKRSEVPSGRVEIEVWVVVQRLGIQEQRKLQETLQPGSVRSLIVTLDPGSKRLTLTLS
ncbi:MAG TPA: protein kinase [Thermoanaerobaculia bacterium]|nr:protein kinase [Thermoanaerobaculia bacterium]